MKEGLVLNRTEFFVYRLMQSLSISEPSDLRINFISTKINVPVIYWEFGSEVVFYRNRFKIFLNRFKSKQEQWQDFGHEVCHVFRHCGTQNRMNLHFLQYQEYQADYFSYHFCVPTFMLRELKEVTVYDVMNLFNVEYDFALRRLEMYRNKIIMKGVTTKCQKDMYGIVAETGGNWK